MSTDKVLLALGYAYLLACHLWLLSSHGGRVESFLQRPYSPKNQKYQLSGLYTKGWPKPRTIGVINYGDRFGIQVWEEGIVAKAFII